MKMFQTLIACASSSSLMLGDDNMNTFTMRPFVSGKDAENLSELCKDVWVGRDYVPSIAPILEKDPSCDFVILEDDKTGKMVAAGNRRLLDEKGTSIWIEAIRVSSKFQGRGVATLMMKEFLRRSKDTGAKEIMSCTSDNNHAMKKVFTKEEIKMEPFHHNSQFPDFSKLKELPGWSATDMSSGDEEKTENILKALQIEHLVGDEAKLEKWEPVKDEEEMKSILKSLKKHGLSGHMPGLGKLMWISDDVRDSLKKGLVRKLCKTTTDGEEPYAILALTKDHAIQSLRSKYVCSIVARTSIGFDSAVWEACKSDIAHTLGGNPAFCVLCDESIFSSSPSALFESIPKGFSFRIFRWKDNE